MNKWTKLLLLLLTCAMLTGLLSACVNKAPERDGETSGGTDSEGEASGNEPSDDARFHAADILGERDLTDEHITFFTRMGGNMWDIKSLYAEDYLSETINDAVYDRNTELENRYHFQILIQESGATSYSNRLKTQILGGSYEFDVVTACGYDMAELAVAGVLRDLTQVDGIGLDRSWWNSTLNQQLTIAGALYYLSGDIICEDNMAVRCVFFNKSLADAIDVPAESLYQMAKEQKWTFDEMSTIASKAYIDLDGVDGKSSGDRLGLIGQTAVAGYVLMTAAGVRITSKNTSGEPVMNPDFNYDVLDSISAYLTRDDSVLITEDALTPYKNGRVLFMTEVLGSVTKIRDWDIKSGIMPMPLYSDAQESYYHFADGNCLNLLALPTGNGRRLEAVTFMMEAMCIESTSTLNPAFYDTCLRGRYSYDPESAEMLDIILGSYFIENANLYKRAWGGLQEEIVDAIASGTSVSGIIASYSESLPALIRNTVSKLREIAQAQRA